MNSNIKTEPKYFYLVTIDILKGFSIFLMIAGHTLLFWDHKIVYKWPDITFAVAFFIAIALLAHPCFFFLYGFNVVDSLLIKKDSSERREIRSRYLKRAMIFFLIAEFCEGSTALVNSPEYLINFLLTWELFHMFALSTILLLLVFEFAWKVESKGYWNHERVIVTVLSVFLILVITIFLLIHDYSNKIGIPGYYVNLDINSILQRTFFEYGQNPVIPWVSFPIVGGLIAVFLNLPHEHRDIVIKKAGVVLTGGILSLIAGFLFLEKERYTSTPTLRPASSSFVFIAIGILTLTTMTLILLIDLNSRYSRKNVNKVLLPVVLVSEISLTLYIVHNVAYIIPPQLIRLIISTEMAILVISIIYALFFIPVAYYWQRWNFKYSLEWMIWKLQRTQWRWWTKPQVKNE